MTLADFLLARIAEDERDARARLQNGEPNHSAVPWKCPSAHRMMAECEAKRRIVESAREPFVIHGGETWFPSELCFLAEVYADHPDYDEEWKP